MPVRAIDLRAVKDEAKERIKTASVSPIRFTAMFLLISLALDLVSTAVGYMLNNTSAQISAVNITLPTFSLSLSFVAVLAALLGTVLYAGYNNYCLCVQRGMTMTYDSLFDAFPFAGKVILLSVVEGILAGFGFMLFIFPGVYVLLVYAFSLYHLCEDPDIGVFEAMRRSRVETKGYKEQLFVLLLSFLPLLLLFALPVGLCEYFVLRGAFPATLSGELLHTLASGVLSGCASLYVEPYLSIAKVGFYRRVTEPPAEELTVKTDGNEENRLE